MGDSGSSRPLVSSSSSAPQASISIFPHHKLNKINRNIYSGFTEHMGRCIYGGIYDPDNPHKHLLTSYPPPPPPPPSSFSLSSSSPSSKSAPTASVYGFRADVIETLRPLSIPVFRYPGGNFCATYHWEDGVGPVSTRPARPSLAWGGVVERNTFGTDEFMAWCRLLDTQPYLCLNMGTGTLDEALAWVEYCNGSGDTYYANLRRRNTGRDEPHRVRYWALGNECWGPWQVEQHTDPRVYADKAYQWAKALKLLDPDIELILCGKEGATSWDYEVLTTCLQPVRDEDGLGEEERRRPLVDMHSIHLYTAGEQDERKRRGSDKENKNESDEKTESKNVDAWHYSNAFAPLAAERAIEVCSSLIDLARIENGVPPGQKRPGICFDEWNVWLPRRAPGSLGAEERYTLSDAVAVGVWLNVLVRGSRDVEMACLAQSVNVISPLMTTSHGLVKQTTWWVYELFCRYMRGRRVAALVDTAAMDATDVGGRGRGGRYVGKTRPAWLGGVKEMKWLDVSAALDEDEDGAGDGGRVCVCVVNVHLTMDLRTSLDGAGLKGGTEKESKVQVFTVTGRDVTVTNMDGKEEVGLVESEWDGGDEYVFPKHSITMMRWRI